MKKQIKTLEMSIGKRVLYLNCDGLAFPLNSKQHVNCNTTHVGIEGLGAIEIDSEEGSHFYGESDLIINVLNENKDSAHMNNLNRISGVIYWLFTPAGFNIFPVKHLVHVEFVTDDIAISIGFIVREPNGNLVVDTSSIHVNAELISGNNNSLERKTISQTHERML